MTLASTANYEQEQTVSYGSGGLTIDANNTTGDEQPLISLKQQANRLEHLLQVMPAGVIVLDAKGIVKQANQQAIELLGEPLEGELWRQVILRAFKPRADDGHEVSLSNGRRVKLSITPLKDEPGQLILVTDLTETRQLQARVSHMQKLSSLGRMVASLAHQIRTPLSAAMLYAMNLSNRSLAEKSKQQFSDKLMSRLRDLEQQVNDMLIFAKSGDQQVVSELSVQTLIENVQAGCDAMLQRHKLQLQVNLPETDVFVLGNQTALASAIQNLVHNAAQVSQANSPIQLSAEIIEQHFIEISVADQGPGIPKQNIKQLFEPFFTTKSHGTGLGLAVVKSVAQSHQGTVHAVNLEGGGARIGIRLPIDNTSIHSPIQQSASVAEA